jgi:MOSC domain-containing protein YiiM
MQSAAHYDELDQNIDVIASSLSSRGGSGENILVDAALNKSTVCLGDVFRCAPAASSNNSHASEVEVDASAVYLQVTSPRRPCYRWDKKYGSDKKKIGWGKSVRHLVHTNCTGGWFVRPLLDGRDLDAVRTKYGEGVEAHDGLVGSLCRGDILTLVHRPHPQWPLERVNALLYGAATVSERVKWTGTLVE